MKNPFSILFLKNLKKNFIKTIKNFPLSALLIFLIFSIFIYIKNFQNFWKPNEIFLYRLNISLIITFLLSSWFYIFSKTEKYNFLKTYFLQLISIIFWILFYSFFEIDFSNLSFENFVFFIITTFWILCFIFFAPFLKEIFKKTKNDEKLYFSYFIEMSKIFLKSIFIALVLSFLGFIAIMSIDTLFNLKNYFNISNFYLNYNIFIFSLFTPFYALSQFVEKKDLKEKKLNNFLVFFIKYIVFSFVILYFIILYAYSVKVLMNFWNWPNWIISWLVIFFSIFAYLAYIFSYNINEKSIIFLRKIIPFAIFPQIFMLFYAIYLRISAYWITINRYLVVIFWIFLILTSLYLIFSKRKFIAVIPFSLTFFSILISIWPWSIYNLPQKSQLALLKADLQKVNILQENGKIVPLKNYDDIKGFWVNIYNKIDYLCDFNNCQEIKNLFKEEYKALFLKEKKEWEESRKSRISIYENAIEEHKDTDKKRTKINRKNLEKIKNETYNWPSKWRIIEYITSKIKVKRYYNEEDKFELNFSTRENKVFDIKWYNKFIKIYNSNYTFKYKNDNKEKYLINLKDNNFILDDKIIKIPFNLKEKLVKEIEKINLKYEEENINEEKVNYLREDEFQKEPLIINFENENKKYKFIISQLALDTRKEKEYYDINWVLLIWEK